jgi:hypothetical protein
MTWLRSIVREVLMALVLALVDVIANVLRPSQA